MRMVRILDAKEISTLLHVVAASEERIDLLERHLPGLRDEEPNERAKQEVYPCEHIECVEAIVFEEGREELLND